MRTVMAAAAVAAVVGAGAAAGIPALAGDGAQRATATAPTLQTVAKRLAGLERRDKAQRRQIAGQRRQIAALRSRAPVPGPAGVAGPAGAQGPAGTPDGYSKAEADARFLGAGATAENADTLGGIPPTAFGTAITHSGLAFRSESDGIGVMPADNTSCVEYPLNVTGSLYRELPVPNGAHVTSVRWRVRNLNGGSVSAYLKQGGSWGAVTTYANGSTSTANFATITATPSGLVVDSSENILVTEVTMGPGDQACEVTVFYSLTD